MEGRKVIGGERSVKVKDEGEEVEKEVKKRGSCVKVGGVVMVEDQRQA